MVIQNHCFSYSELKEVAVFTLIVGILGLLQNGLLHMTLPENQTFIINACVLDADANPVDQPFTLAVVGGKITAIEAEAERLRSFHSEVCDAKSLILLSGYETPA